MTVPPGALVAPIEFSIAEADDVATAPDVAVGPAVRIEPATPLAKSVTVRIPFAMTRLPGGRSPSEIIGLKRNDQTGAIEQVLPSSVDSSTGFIILDVRSLSTFQAVIRPSGEGPIRVASLSIDPPRPGVGAPATLSWTIAGSPSSLVLTSATGTANVLGTLSRGVVPFPTSPTAGDPATFFKLAATNAEMPREIDRVAAELLLPPAGDYEVGSVATLSNGGAVVAGRFRGALSIGDGTTLGAAGDYDALIIRFSAEGQVVWARGAGGGGFDAAWGIAVAADDTILVTGTFDGAAVFGAGGPGAVTLTGAGGADGFLAAYRPDGALVWAKSFGGGLGDTGASVAELPGGDVALSGVFRGSATFGSGEAGERTISGGSLGIFVARYRADGTLAWAKAADGSVVEGTRHLVSFFDGSLALTGYFHGSAVFGAGEANQTTLTTTGASDADMFVARFAPDGTLRWAKSAGAPIATSAADVGHSVASLPDGSTVAVGIFEGAALFGRGEPGATTLTSAPGSVDMYIARYAPDGALAWARRAGGTADDEMFGVDSFPDGTIVAVGKFTGAATFGSGEPFETTLAGSPGEQRAFVSHYEPDGGLIRAVQAPGDIGRGARASASGGFVVVGPPRPPRYEPVNYRILRVLPSPAP